MQKRKWESLPFLHLIRLKTFTLTYFLINLPLFTLNFLSKIMYIYLISENSYDTISLLFLILTQ
jgi:hypothetical protein